MYIGNTEHDFNDSFGVSVYPYVYREHVSKIEKNSLEQRFIPMYIGNTNILFSPYLPPSVYPYVYREH